jgi:SAM-dependent methyltransferase
MHPETYKMVAEREDTYWWQVARRAMGIRLLNHCGIPRGGRWLDLGCGAGGNLALSDSFDPSLAVGVDVSTIAVAIAKRKKPHARLVRADLNNALPFDDATFDVVTVFNVLYHDWVKSEAAVIAQINRVLRPGGVLLITEPAFAVLARDMDVASMGHRRYRIADIAGLCGAAGLRVDHASYFTSFGFPLLLAMKVLRRLKPAKLAAQLETGADMKPLNPVANEMLRRLSSWESWVISAGFRVPLGTTLLCLARRI